MSVESELTMPCLGRPFQLGMLYDCRSDQLLPRAATLWNQEKMKQAIDSKQKQTSDYEIIAENSMDVKMSKLEVNTSLKLSLLAGLVKVSGAATYLNDRTSSQDQVRVSLKYKSTSWVEQLAIDRLHGLDNPDVIKDKTATHVISGVLYGADAIFIFDQQVSDDENVYGFMKTMVEKLPTISTSGDVALDISDADKRSMQKFDCTLYCDLLLPERPSTFEGAVKLYKDLPKLLSGNNFPKKVWLYPLSKLNSKAAVGLQISINLANQTQKVMEELHKLEVQSSDLMNSKVCTCFPHIQEQLSRFKGQIKDYKGDFTKNLAVLLPQIREGDKQETELTEIFREKCASSSPFNYRLLSSWIEGKTREIKILQTYLSNMKDIQFAFSPGDMDSILSDLEYNQVVSFTFTVARNHDPYLEEMATYLCTHKTSQKVENPAPWYRNPKILSSMKLLAKQFKNFAEANQGRKTKFVITSSSEQSDKAAVIELHKDFCKQIFDPPDKPGEPKAISVTHNSIQLKWLKPIYGSQNVKLYTILYRDNNTPFEEWMETKTSGAEESVMVHHLDAEKEYSFKVRAECEAGISPVSGVSDPIPTTVLSRPPGKPTASTVTHKSVQLKWSKPQYGGRNVEFYTISYHEVKDSPQQETQWKQAKVHSEKESATLNCLTAQTQYQFKVHAHFKTDLCLPMISESSDPIQTYPFPVSPCKLIASEVTHESVHLQWSKVEYESQNTEFYRVLYHEIKDPPDSEPQWMELKTDGPKECITVSGLAAQISYSFKVCAKFEDGMSLFSDASDPICTTSLPVPPGKPTAANVTHSSVQLQWSKPQYKDNDVQFYAVFYHMHDTKDSPNLEIQWKEFVVESEEESAKVSGLAAKTQYYFKVNAKFKTGGSLVSDISDPIQTYPLPEPPGKPTASTADITHNSIQVEWSNPCKAQSIKFYTLFYHETKDPCTQEHWKELETDDPIIKESITVSDLVAETEYSFKVCATFEADTTIFSEVSDPIKTYPFPILPGKPSASSVTHNSVELVWSKPQYRAENVKSYALCYCENKDSPHQEQWKEVKVLNTNESFTASNLAVHTEYCFKIHAEFAKITLVSEISDPIWTQPPPLSPGQPFVSKVNHNSIKLEWSKSQYQGQNAELYTVLYCEVKGSPELNKWKEIESHSTSISVSNLLPHTQYSFKVHTKFKPDVCLESEISGPILTKPFPVPPGKPYASNVTHNSIQLEWSKPRYGEKTIEFYTLYYSMVKDPLLWKVMKELGPICKESMMVSDLIPQTEYCFSMYAKFEGDVTLQSDISETIRTFPFPAVAPGKPTAYNVTYSCIELQWSRAYRGEQEVDYYTVCFHKDNDPPDQQWEEIKILSTFTSVHNLDAQSVYFFKVQAMFKQSGRLISEVSDPIQTHPVPIANKPTAFNVAHNSIHLELSNLSQCKDANVHHTIQYCKRVESPDAELWKEVEVGTHDGKNSMVVHGLAPQTQYVFQIHSEDSAGIKKFSDVSDPIQTCPFPVPPGKPTASIVTHNRIELKWSKAQYKTQIAKYYTILMANPSDQEQWKEVVTDGPICNESAVIGSLAAEKRYTFKVRATFEADITETSEISDAIQIHSPSIPPGKPIASNVTHNSIQLQWSKPQYTAQNIEQYTILYYEITDAPDPKQWKEVGVNSTKELATVSNLAVQTEYCFSIRAEFKDGIKLISCISDPIQTLPPPVPPGKPIVSNVTHNSVKLEWSKPHHETQDVEYYTVFNREIKPQVPSNWIEITQTSAASTTIMVNDLSSQTKFSFKVQAKFKTGHTMDSNSSDSIQTHPFSVSPGKPAACNVTQRSIQLDWSKAQYGEQNVDLYEVHYSKSKDPTKIWEVNTPIHKESVKVHGLAPQTEYSFEIHAKFKAGITLVSSISESITTDPIYVRPGKPTVHSVTHKSIKLQWSRAYRGQQNAESYDVHYHKVNNSPNLEKWTKLKPVVDTFTMVPNLVAHSEYTFQVYAIFRDGTVLVSDMSRPIQTYPPPVPPGKPITYDVTHNSVKLEWSKSQYGGENVEHHIITYYKMKSPSEQTAMETKIINKELVSSLCGLDPYSEYTFTVSAIFKSDTLVSEVSDPIFTNPAPVKPGKPYPSGVAHNNIQLQWLKPQYGADKIDTYTVCYREIKDPPEEWNFKVSNEEHFTVCNLDAKKKYCFKIRADVRRSCDVFSEVSDVSESIETKNRIALQMLSRNPIEDPPLNFHKLEMNVVAEDKEKMIRKCNVRNYPSSIQSKEKVLMVVGATGAGKSTVINSMINYILGVEWEDNFRFKLITDEGAHSQAKSQTKWITAYTLPKMEGSPVPYTLTIIDTPGFGDTEGLERDKFITSQIKDFFSMSPPNGIDHINAIGFVTQSPQARLTPTQKYIFDSILSIFGKDVADDIFMMITFADGQHPQVMTAVKEANIPCSTFYKFNNSALFASNEINDEEDHFNQMFWNMGVSSFRKFFTKFDEAKPKSLQLTREVLDEREQLEAIVISLQPQIRNCLAKIEKMRQEEMILQSHEAEITTNKTFIYEVEVPKQRKVSVEGKSATNCLQCKSTCHEDCKISKNEEMFHCLIINAAGRCRVCPEKCDWDQHVNNPYKFEPYMVKEKRTAEDLKKKYFEAVSGRTQHENMMANIEKQLKDMHAHVLSDIEQMRHCLHRLDEIALKPNPLTEVEYLELLIESEKQQAQSGWQHRVQYLEEAKQQAAVILNIKVKDTPELYQENSTYKSNAESWYSRFTYWTPVVGGIAIAVVTTAGVLMKPPRL